MISPGSRPNHGIFGPRTKRIPTPTMTIPANIKNFPMSGIGLISELINLGIEGFRNSLIPKFGILENLCPNLGPFSTVVK
jgi:hypothetical protein